MLHIYFLSLFFFCISLHGMEEKREIIPFAQVWDTSHKVDNIIKHATHYIYILNNPGIKSNSGPPFYSVSFYKNDFSLEKSKPIHTIFLGMNPRWQCWTETHASYCNNLLDPENKIVPDFLQIKKNESENSHLLYLYCGEKLMNIHDFEVPDQSQRHAEGKNFMDVKNSDNPCAYYFQPPTFFQGVKQGEHHNGTYIDTVGIYDYTNTFTIVKIPSWHHTESKTINTNANSQNNKILFLENINKELPESIKGAVYYIFSYSSAHVIKEDMLVKAGTKYHRPPHLPIFTVKFYGHENHKPFFEQQIEADDSHTWTNEHETYCNALLDKNRILPNRVEINYPLMFFPSIYVYYDQTLIGNHNFVESMRQSQEVHFMDLRNPKHSFKEVIRPINIFDQIEYINYHNGYYAYLTGTYDKNNRLILKYTWQHELVIGSIISSAAFLLYYYSEIQKNIA